MIDKKLSGIIPVLITPLNKDKSIDAVALKNLCEYYEYNQKVSGVWVLGTGRQHMCLSYKQRLTVAQIVAESFSDNVIKIIGCSFYSPQESVNFISDVEDFDFDAYHAMPYHPKVSLGQIYTWYKKLAKKCDKPLWAYTSGNWAQHMGPDFIARLKTIPNIVGVKYSSSNIVDIQGAIALQDENFQVITAVIKTLYSSLCLGIKAATSVEASIFIPEIRKIFELYIAGDHQGALEAQKYLNTRMLQYPSPAARDNFLRVAEIKYIMSKEAMCKEYVSDYYRELSDAEKTELEIWYDENITATRLS